MKKSLQKIIIGLVISFFLSVIGFVTFYFFNIENFLTLSLIIFGAVFAEIFLLIIFWILFSFIRKK